MKAFKMIYLTELKSLRYILLIYMKFSQKAYEIDEIDTLILQKRKLRIENELQTQRYSATQSWS